jgi:hypothetical protein
MAIGKITVIFLQRQAIPKGTDNNNVFYLCGWYGYFSRTKRSEKTWHELNASKEPYEVVLTNAEFKVWILQEVANRNVRIVSVLNHILTRIQMGEDVYLTHDTADTTAYIIKEMIEDRVRQYATVAA